VRTGAAGAVRLLGWARRESSTLDDPLGEIDPTHASTTRSAVQAAGGSVGWRGRPREPLTLAVVLDARAERFVPDASQRLAASAPASRLAGGLGADLEWRPTPSLTVSATVRADARRDDATGNVSLDGRPLGLTSDFAPTGHLGASFRAAD